MSTDKRLSISFYKYLCQKIGSEEDVRVRRLSYIIDDIGTEIKSLNKITSGSKGEVLNFKGSDLDIMFIDSQFIVYESDTKAVPKSQGTSLVIDIEDTHPCFTQLRLFNTQISHLELQESLNTIFVGDRLSSQLYKLHYMKIGLYQNPNVHSLTTIHGPCISSSNGSNDFAFCLKCDQWISQAQAWTIRSRTAWPSPDLISKIISCGVSSIVPLELHLDGKTSCRSALRQLEMTLVMTRLEFLGMNPFDNLSLTQSLICHGIGNQMLGDIDCTKTSFY
ncbi:unnamed protein product [Mytilus coruscus]|uniref:Mab-21-like nucleotidyltransferase domain-containing protein n=1 Tax=Mytilus coruscus TaxID=42192 RepID=A0A6J8ATN7_MYTCO|nr:unnamed protein product [Mytilus coruscus]